jgi:hypothetical protein
MPQPRVIVSPPSPAGGRQVRVDDRVLGIAHSLHDLTAFLCDAGLTGWNDLDVLEADFIEWHEGGPEVWS